MAVPSDYNPLIPQPTDALNQSQADLLNNFGALQAWLDVNHVDYASANAGKHNVCEFPSPTTFAGTSGNEVALYANASAYTGNPALFFQKESGGAAYEFTESAQTTAGWTFLPSGILLKWGTVTFNANPLTVTFPTGASIPAFTAVLNIQVTLIDSAAVASTLGIKTITSPTSFQVYGTNSGTTQLAYFAIGY